MQMAPDVAEALERKSGLKPILRKQCHGHWELVVLLPNGAFSVYDTAESAARARARYGGKDPRPDRPAVIDLRPRTAVQPSPPPRAPRPSDLPARRPLTQSSPVPDEQGWSELGNWRLTQHARERAAERGVEMGQLLKMLNYPARTTPDPKRREDLRLYAGDGVVAIVNPEEHVVVTCGAAGALDWKREA